MTDPISDMLTRIRNSHQALTPTIQLPHSKMKEGIARILKSEGFITDFAVDGSPLKTLKISLKYQGRRRVIEGLRRISTPGLRRYVGATEIPRVKNGLGTAIISTSQGLMTGMDARKNNLGGELVCYIW